MGFLGVSEAERAQVRRALAGLGAGGGEGGFDELVGRLRVLEVAEREIQRAKVEVVARLQRDGAFAERGQRAETALADLWRVERAEARRVVTGAEHALARADLQGQVLPARLPATAAAFEAGTAGLRHVEVIARLMDGAAAGRLEPDTWASAERQIAARTADYTPTELRVWGHQLLELLDQDGAAPDEREPEPVNELFLCPDRSGCGGRLKGRFDAALYDVIAAVLDAKAAPLTEQDTRPLERRQAEAMGEVFGWVADHGDSDVLPAAGGNRPHVNVHISLTDLENRARAAVLDFGGPISPSLLRWLCCDAGIVPIVLDGAGQPLDVGRLRRTIPDGLRRAVAARDRGCAHPGCDRPVSWCEIHHIIPWEQGGETKLANLVMLCRIHHRETHFSEWIVRIAPDGIPEFLPPPWIDPTRTPRRTPRCPSGAAASPGPPGRPGRGHRPGMPHRRGHLIGAPPRGGP